MNARIHPSQLLLGGSCLVLTVFALGRPMEPRPEDVEHEYKVVEDVTGERAQELAEDGWEYVGYLGRGVKGQTNDETLWRKPSDD